MKSRQVEFGLSGRSSEVLRGEMRGNQDGVRGNHGVLQRQEGAHTYAVQWAAEDSSTWSHQGRATALEAGLIGLVPSGTASPLHQFCHCTTKLKAPSGLFDPRGPHGSSCQPMSIYSLYKSSTPRHWAGLCPEKSRMEMRRRPGPHSVQS
jgi:hypothetical protein